jgi:hypothetical protein
MVDIENTTIAGNWIGGAPWYGFPMSANAGLVCKEWSTGFPRGCVGVLTDSVVGWNEVGDPLSWDQHQIYGDQDLVKDGLVAYGHDPVETDVADLMFDPTNAVGPVIGADPGFDGFNTGGPFSAGDPPWTLPFPATYSIYRGAVGGLIDDPMGFTIDKVGAFSGPDDTWCVGIELQTCVPL